MEPSGGQTPLPLPPSPFEQATAPPSSGSYPFQTAGTVGPVGAPASPPKKGPPKAAGAVFVIVLVAAILAFSGVLDGLFAPSGSNQPNVQVTNTSASHTCPYGGTPVETYHFTLVNGGSVNAQATIGFYLNDARVQSGTYQAPAGSSTPYTVTAYLTACPPSGSTYYLDLVSVSAL